MQRLLYSGEASLLGQQWSGPPSTTQCHLFVPCSLASSEAIEAKICHRKDYFRKFFQGFGLVYLRVFIAQEMQLHLVVQCCVLGDPQKSIEYNDVIKFFKLCIVVQ